MNRTILGSGVSGLAAAHYLLKKDPKAPLSILEASGRIGGWIRTTPSGDGVIFEQGPRTIRPRGAPGANTLKLLEELNLTHKIRPISTSHPAATNRMIYVNGELHSLPSSFTSLFKKQKPFSKPIIAYLMKEFFVPSKKISRNDESIYDFVNRRLGKEISDYLISPMICGICGGNAKEISVKFLMESLFDKEQKYGSISKGIIKSVLDRSYKKQAELIQQSRLRERAMNEKWNVYSFDGGLEILPQALYDSIKLQGSDVTLNSNCESMEFNDGVVKLVFGDGKIIDTKHVISSIPAEKLGKLLEKQHPQLAALLNKIRTVSLGVVNLKYNGKILQKDGFGFLVAPDEGLPILGVIYDSCCFPYGENTVLTVMMGGHWFKNYFGDHPNEEQMLNVALEQVQNILKIGVKPDDVKVNILHNCIPQYTVGHNDNVANIHSYIKENNLKLSLCGASYRGVGVNDVIFSAKKVVDDL